MGVSHPQGEPGIEKRPMRKVRLNLQAIERSLRAVQQEFPKINEKVRSRRGTAGSGAPAPRLGKRYRQNGGGRHCDADGARGGAVEATGQRIGRAEQTDGAQRGERDVESGLGEETPLAVEHADERRVEGIDEEHRGEDAQRFEHVGRVLEIGGDGSQREKSKSEDRSEPGVDEERAPLRLLFVSFRSAGYGP